MNELNTFFDPCLFYISTKAKFLTFENYIWQVHELKSDMAVQIMKYQLLQNSEHTVHWTNQLTPVAFD